MNKLKILLKIQNMVFGYIIRQFACGKRKRSEQRMLCSILAANLQIIASKGGHIGFFENFKYGLLHNYAE